MELEDAYRSGRPGVARVQRLKAFLEKSLNKWKSDVDEGVKYETRRVSFPMLEKFIKVDVSWTIRDRVLWSRYISEQSVSVITAVLSRNSSEHWTNVRFDNAPEQRVRLVVTESTIAESIIRMVVRVTPCLTLERPVGKLEDQSDDLPPVPHAENKEAKEGHRDHREPEGKRLVCPVNRTVISSVDTQNRQLIDTSKPAIN
jgi:hypothetical protein